MPKIACNAELAPKIVLLLLLVTLVICGALTLVSLPILARYHTYQSLHLHANMTDAIKKAICTCRQGILCNCVHLTPCTEAICHCDHPQ